MSYKHIYKKIKNIFQKISFLADFFDIYICKTNQHIKGDKQR